MHMQMHLHSWLPHVPLQVFAMIAAFFALLVAFGIFHDRMTGRAEQRAEVRKVQNELAGVVVIPAAVWTPGAGEATRHFFGTDYVEYDPDAHTEEILSKMRADTDAFLSYIRILARY